MQFNKLEIQAGKIAHDSRASDALKTECGKKLIIFEIETARRRNVLARYGHQLRLDGWLELGRRDVHA